MSSDLHSGPGEQLRDHQVFGGVLRSPLDWPELRPAGPVGSPEWELRLGCSEPLAPARRLLGAHRYAGDVEVRLQSAGGLWRVETSDIGDFDITDRGRRITWRPTHLGQRELELARFDMLGRVLPLALHRAGALSLHGSAVATPVGAILLLGPKGRGKSTLALALAQQGALLLTDDVAVVEHDGEATRVRPGVHAMRLWPDSAAELGTGTYGQPGAVGRKLLIHSLPEPMLATAAVPVASVYLLEPAGVEADVHAPVARAPLAPVEATRRLLSQATAGNLLGGDAAGEVLTRVAELVRRVPVQTLRIPRELGRLQESAAAVLGWHDGGAVARRGGCA